MWRLKGKNINTTMQFMAFSIRNISRDFEFHFLKSISMCFRVSLSTLGSHLQLYHLVNRGRQQSRNLVHCLPSQAESSSSSSSGRRRGRRRWRWGRRRR